MRRVDPLCWAWQGNIGSLNRQPFRMNPMNDYRHAARLALGAIVALALCAGCGSRDPGPPPGLSPGVALDRQDAPALHDRIAGAVQAAPPGVGNGGGLIGVLGGARVKLLRTGTHELLLPLPQFTETQIPLCHALVTQPREAAKQCRLHLRDGANAVIIVELEGQRDREVQMDWSAVILIANQPASRAPQAAEVHRSATPCVEYSASQVQTLADRLWPASGKPAEYAANIQGFIRQMKQTKPPRSLDALGILESGGNWICTANANLAAALLRAKGLPARSLAVIPPTGQRLEMHRIVEYSEADLWHAFDPSSLQTNVPLKPWQNVIMAVTTPADEALAMKPRAGAALGCPYGHELELVRGHLTPWGTDFFWTQGKRLAAFDPGEEAIVLARQAWSDFLASGKLSGQQVRAASVANAAGLLEALRPD